MFKLLRDISLVLIIITAGSFRQACSQSPDFTGYRLFINPGHGGNDSDDRHMLVADFWESEGNLVKGLFLRDIMTRLKATVFISRVTNTTADDLPLSSISAMANSANVDFFLAIHSNGYDGTQNQPLMLFRGYDNQPVFPESKTIAGILWQKLFEKGNCWTGSSVWVKGDWSFYPEWGTQGLGVLRGLTMPGVLSEGSFHDYIPESWRLKNHDFLHHESWAFTRALIEHENVAPVSNGLIAGIVRDSLRSPSWYFKPGTKDKSLPLNDLEVTLIPGNRKYKIDNLNNGFFMFDSVAPGPYKIIFDKAAGFLKDSLEVNVVRNKSTLADICLKFDTTIIPAVLSVSPQSIDSVAFNQEFTIAFSLPMNRDSVQKAVSINPYAQLGYSWNDLSTILRIKPLVKYASNTNYNVTISTTACSKWKVDIGSPYSFTFVTKNRKRLVLEKSFPRNGQDNISIYPQIRLLFDAPLNESLLPAGIKFLNDAGQPVSRIKEIYYEKDGKGYYNFEPAETLTLGKTFKIVLDQNLADIGGIVLGTKHEINFTTRSEVYHTGPVVESFDDISVFWDPEASGSTIGTDNPLTTFTESSSVKRGGTCSGRLDYVFVNETGGICRTYDTRKPRFGYDGLMEFAIWVYGDLSYNILEYWFYSTDNLNKIVVVDTIDWAGWELKGIPVSSIGGIDNFNYHSVVIRQTSGGVRSGTMWFDEAQIVLPTGIQDRPDYRTDIDMAVFPNPFSGTGNICLSLGEPAEMKLEVYSLAGTRIASVAQGKLDPGYYIYEWTPGSSIGSGIYFYRLEIRKTGITLPSVYTKKCVLIR
ncbi:MAG: Ig-like domain-containing protein [Bacteroidia bacterium]|nr:Ig-like domain-containing protein [Bacteroidia bacterium]